MELQTFKQKWIKDWMKHRLVKWSLLSILAIILISIIGYNLIILGGKMVIDDKGFVFSEASVITSASGEEVATLYSENRTFVPFDQIPKHVVNAFIAIEDERFYDHAGVDFISVLRAIYKDIIHMDKVEGASTITQQLVKNVFLTNDKTWMRKTKEVMGAIYLERTVSKNNILEYYLNEIYFGHGVYGIEKAAQYFFGKSVQDLTVSEGALLAAIPKAPSHYSPVNNPENALTRRNLVLSKMYELEMINAEELTAYQGRTLGIDIHDLPSRPWIESYVDVVLREIEEKYHISREEIYRGGYEIVTGINPKAQQIAYELFQNDAYFNGPKPGVEGSFVLMDGRSGAIVAAIGGREYSLGDLNRVFVKRQPGSVMKPLAVYGPALELEQYDPYTLLKDEKMTYDGNYTPQNYDYQYEGEVTLYDALKESKNAPAVWLLNEIGISYSKEFLTKLGISLPNDHNLSIALGGLYEGVTPIELVQAFRAFLHDGKSVAPYTVLKIKNKDGEVVAEAETAETKVFSSQNAWNMTNMLEAVVQSGTATTGEYKKALAGKTGSTEHPHQEGMFKDTWFVGYTPEYVGAVWIGYDQSDENHYLTTGSSAPTKLMKDFLTQFDLSENLQEEFVKPNGLKEFEQPVYLPVITDLKGDKTFGLFKGVTAELQWSISEDDRVIYQVYEKTDDDDRLLGELEGKGFFVDREVKMLEERTYYVVPVNPITNQKGQKSNEVTVK